jgi:hypothetical protein
LRFKNWQWKEVIKIKLGILVSLSIAIAFVYLFHLTNFQLFNRVQSTGTGLQKITISCNSDRRDALQCVSTDTVVRDISELEKYNCRFINLEDIEKEKAEGNKILEIYRQDPNIQTRSEIYRRSWTEIKNHPVLGIGWGGISNILGRDGRGTPLNSSNIFLETYLGAGILGFLALIILLGYILIKSVKNYYYAQNDLQKAMSLFIIISWFAIVVTNLFNAGIFLGIFWVWLAITQVKD